MNNNFPRYPTEPRRPIRILPLPPQMGAMPQTPPYVSTPLPPQMGAMPQTPSIRSQRPMRVPTPSAPRSRSPMLGDLRITENFQQKSEPTRRDPQIRKSPFGTAFSDKNRPR